MASICFMSAKSIHDIYFYKLLCLPVVLSDRFVSAAHDLRGLPMVPKCLPGLVHQALFNLETFDSIYHPLTNKMICNLSGVTTPQKLTHTPPTLA